MNTYTELPESYRVNSGNQEPPECPPEGEYTIRFLGIKEIGKSRPFRETDEPRDQFTLEFKIDGTGGTVIQQEWHNFDLIGWYSPIMHYNPNLPGYTGTRYTEPNLYKLTRAMNGGTPVELPIIPNKETGKPEYDYDAIAELRKFEGSRFRSVIGKSQSGWPKLKGDPMPILPEASGRRRRAAAVSPEPVPAAAAPADESDPFEDDELS